MKKDRKTEVDEIYMRQIYSNILRAIVIIFYFLVLNIAYQNINSEIFDFGTKILTMTILFLAILIFEIAYKKDNDGLTILGIEVLILAIYTITTEYITRKYEFNFKNYSYSASYIYAIYFVLKGIIIYTKGRKKIADERSDIREIVQNDKPIKKEAKKRNTDVEVEVKIEVKKKPKKKKGVKKND